MTNYLKLFAGFIFSRLKSNIITYSHTFPHYPQFCGLHFLFRQTEFHKKIRKLSTYAAFVKNCRLRHFCPTVQRQKGTAADNSVSRFSNNIKQLFTDSTIRLIKLSGEHLRPTKKMPLFKCFSATKH